MYSESGTRSSAETASAETRRNRQSCLRKSLAKARHSSSASGLGSFDVVRTKSVLSSLFVSAAASTLVPPSRLARQKERFAVSEVRGSPSRATSLRVSPTRDANFSMSAERSPGMET